MVHSRNIRLAVKRMSLRLGATLFGVTAAVLAVAAQTSESHFKLTFDKPATKWTKALPLGNGRIGAMVFGGTQDERLQINESTLWGGGPHNYTNSQASMYLDEISWFKAGGIRRQQRSSFASY